MDHISIPVADAARSKAFYEPVLETLGWACTGWREGQFVAFKKPGSPAFYLIVAAAITQTHVAFKATSEAEVAVFYEAALRAGGSDNGSPGKRPDYGRDYYAAFVLDPDGHNLEAVLGGVG